jgi:hypothetical protein
MDHSQVRTHRLINLLGNADIASTSIRISAWKYPKDHARHMYVDQKLSHGFYIEQTEDLRNHLGRGISPTYSKSIESMHFLFG